MKIVRKLDWLIYLFIILTSIYSLKDLFKPYFYTSHDGIHQVVRFYYFDQVVKDGQIPPRWVSGLLNGYGYPLFNFSYHMPWIISEIFHLLGLDIFQSIKMTFLAGFILSGMFMFILLKKIFDRLSAFTGMLIYLYAPYRFSNIFVRAAIGDATVFLFAPLFFYALLNIKDSKKIQPSMVVMGSLSLSAIILSHAMVSFFFLAAGCIYCLLSVFFKKEKIMFLLNNILVIIGSFLISAYYFFPSLIERNSTKFNEIIGSGFTGQEYLNLNRLIYSTWGFGTVDAKEGSMSLQIGLAQILAVLFCVMLLIFTILKRRSVKKSKSILVNSLFFILIFFVSIFLILAVSNPVWTVVNKIVLIDFPWRILELTVFASAFLASAFIFFLKNRYLKILFSLFLVMIAFYANRNHLRINQTLDWDMNFYLNLEKTTNSYDEYTPKIVSFDVNKKYKIKVEPEKSDSAVEIDKNKSNKLLFTIKSPTAQTVKINSIYYPGWQAKVNGQVNKIENKNGLIYLNVPEGQALVDLSFGETPLRLLSDAVTIISLLISIYLLIKYKKHHA